MKKQWDVLQVLMALGLVIGYFFMLMKEKIENFNSKLFSSLSLRSSVRQATRERQESYKINTSSLEFTTDIFYTISHMIGEQMQKILGPGFPRFLRNLRHSTFSASLSFLRGRSTRQNRVGVGKLKQPVVHIFRW